MIDVLCVCVCGGVCKYFIIYYNIRTTIIYYYSVMTYISWRGFISLAKQTGGGTLEPLTACVLSLLLGNAQWR